MNHTGSDLVVDEATMTPESTRQTKPETDHAYVLAIDLGSGGLKIALVSDMGKVVASTELPITTHMLPGGGAEQDPGEWWQKTLQGSKRIIDDTQIPKEQILAVACDSQWSLAVAVDESGHHLAPAIHWLDTRGGPYNRKLMTGFPSVKGYGLKRLIKWLRLTGMVPTLSGIDSLGHILFIKNEKPELYKQAFKFVEPMDYLTARLTGELTATQKTMVPFMLSDNRHWDNRKYNPKLLSLAGLEEAKFPELIPNDGIVGNLKSDVASELGLSPTTKVIAGIGDSNASLIGAGALSDFEAVIYIGTSMYMTCHLPFKKTDVLHAMTSLPSPFKDRYYLLGEQGIGGRCVEHFLKNMVLSKEPSTETKISWNYFERFNRMASRVKAGSNGLLFLPWLNGSIVPDENPYARGGFVNMSLGTDRSHMARAIMESLAYNNRWTLEPAEKFLGEKIENVRFAGGGALSGLWAQIHADILEIPVHQVEDPKTTTVRGTALLAFYILGHLSMGDIKDRVIIKKIYVPDHTNRDVYQRMFKAYRSFYRCNKSVFKALNQR